MARASSPCRPAWRTAGASPPPAKTASSRRPGSTGRSTRTHRGCPTTRPCVAAPGQRGRRHDCGLMTAGRARRSGLPAYYLIGAGAQPGGTGPDLYLGPLRAAGPRRVAVAPGIADGPGQAARVLDTLSSLEQGPWWPPLDELIDRARRFYAGGLAETQPVT